MDKEGDASWYDDQFADEKDAVDICVYSAEGQQHTCEALGIWPTMTALAQSRAAGYLDLIGEPFLETVRPTE